MQQSSRPVASTQWGKTYLHPTRHSDRFFFVDALKDRSLGTHRYVISYIRRVTLATEYWCPTHST